MSTHQFRGQGRRRRKRSRFSQASTRRGITLTDQHGREWTAQAGLKTGMPTGLIVPNFRAPWYPDQQYLKVNPDNTSELFIDYRPMLLRRRARMNEYHKGALEWCHDAKVPEPTVLGEYSAQIRRGYGAPPKPLQPIVAAIQGNKYILGETQKVDKRLERFVTKRADEELIADYDFTDQEATSPAGASEGADVRPATRPRRAPRPKPESLIDEAEDLKAFGDFGGEDTSAGGEEGGEEGGDEGGEEGGGDIEGILDQLDDEGDGAEHDEELDEEFDPAVTGGTTVAPQAADRAAKQAPRRPASTPNRTRHGAKRSGQGSKLSDAKRRQMGDRPTLASGAPPAIADE